MKKLMLIAMAVIAIAGCSNKTPDLKSPCVGADDSPCVRRPVNIS